MAATRWLRIRCDWCAYDTKKYSCSERLTGALLDRLTHHVHILEMNGVSRTAGRRKTPAHNSLLPRWAGRLTLGGGFRSARRKTFTPPLTLYRDLKGNSNVVL
jgi:hypothetical protein